MEHVRQAFDCVMPAAGRSLRMGSSKLLLPFGGSTVAERSVANALAFCARVILVVGHRGEELEELFSREERVRIVHNPRFDTGMFASIHRGASEVASERFLVALADMPLIGAGTYRLLAAFAESPERRRSVVRPVYHGVPGHPVLFPIGAARLIAALGPEAATRDLLALLPLEQMPVEDSGVVLDIDTPEDYERAQALA